MNGIFSAQSKIAFSTILSAAFGLACQLHASPSPSMNFLKEPLYLAYQKADKRQSIAEYLPKKQNLENFERMTAVYFYAGHAQSAIVAAQLKLEEIKKRKAEGDPVANATLYEAPGSKGSEAIVDFVISDPKWTIAEHNIMLFKELPAGMLLVKYVRRLYLEDKTDSDMKEFLLAIKNKREVFFKEMKECNWPLPALARKTK